MTKQKAKAPKSTKIRVYITSSNRVSISVPWTDPRNVDAAESHIRHLVEVSRESIPIQKQTNAWIANIPEKLRNKLIGVGLIKDRCLDRWPRFVFAFMQKYIHSRQDWKKPENYQQGVNHFKTFLDNRDLQFCDLSSGMVDDFHRWMQRKRNLSANTAGQHIKRLKQITKAAMDYEVADSNPFEKVKTNLSSDSTKNEYITQEMFEAVLEACPTKEWRVLLALARIAGARCPSEIVGLCWADIDWDKLTILLKSPKTARCGKHERTLPLFSKLARELSALRDELIRNDSWSLEQKVLPMVRDDDQNLRKGLSAIIEQAGLEPWPKPFMALRRSARNELEHSRMFTEFELSQWFGHSPNVAKKYYLDINDDVIKRAAEYGTEKKCLEKCPSQPFERLQGFLKKAFRPVNFKDFQAEIASLKVSEYTYLGSNQKPSVP